MYSALLGIALILVPVRYTRIIQIFIPVFYPHLSLAPIVHDYSSTFSPTPQIHPPLVADDEEVFLDNRSNPLPVEDGGGVGYPVPFTSVNFPTTGLPCAGAVDGRRPPPGRRD